MEAPLCLYIQCLYIQNTYNAYTYNAYTYNHHISVLILCAESWCGVGCRYHKLTLTLLKASWQRAQQLVASRADAIRQVAQDLLAADDEQLTGQAVVKIIEVGCALSVFRALCAFCGFCTLPISYCTLPIYLRRRSGIGYAGYLSHMSLTVLSCISAVCLLVEHVTESPASHVLRSLSDLC